MPDEFASTTGDDRGAACAQATAAILGLMERAGVSRSELARRLGASPAHVTQILRGDTNFTLASLEKLAAALGAEIEVHFAPVEQRAEPGPQAAKRPVAPATGTAATPERPRRGERPRRREKPRPAPPPQPDSSWRVW